MRIYQLSASKSSGFPKSVTGGGFVPEPSVERDDPCPPAPPPRICGWNPLRMWLFHRISGISMDGITVSSHSMPFQGPFFGRVYLNWEDGHQVSPTCCISAYLSCDAGGTSEAVGSTRSSRRFMPLSQTATSGHPMSGSSVQTMKGWDCWDEQWPANLWKVSWCVPMSLCPAGCHWWLERYLHPWHYPCDRTKGRKRQAVLFVFSLSGVQQIQGTTVISYKS